MKCTVLKIWFKKTQTTSQSLWRQCKELESGGGGFEGVLYFFLVLYNILKNIFTIIIFDTKRSASATDIGAHSEEYLR